MERNAVIRPDGGGDAALRPGAGGCGLQRAGTEQDDRLGEGEGRHQPGGTCADDDRLVVQRAHLTASMRSTESRAGAINSGSIVTSVCSVSRHSRILPRVMRFICGHRLQGRMNSGAGMVDGDIIAHRAFGDQHDAGGIFARDVIAHRRRRAREIGLRHDLGRAFGMGEDGHPRMARAQVDDLLRGEALMHFAMPRPGDDFNAGLRGDVLREEFIGQHDDFGYAEALHDFLRIAGGAADVGCGFHGGGGVDVANHGHAGIALAQECDIGGGDAVRQRAAGAGVGNEHRFRGVQQLCGFGHEMHAGEDDDIGVHAHGFAGQSQAVAYDIGDAMEDFRGLVIMRQDDRVALALEAVDGLDIAGENLPFGGRDDAGDVLIKLVEI